MIESVQRRAAKWIKSSFNPSTFQWSKSNGECLKELGWLSLEKRRNYACIAMLYSIMHNFTPIRFSDYLQMNDLSSGSHSLSIRCLTSSINAFRHSFFHHYIYMELNPC